MIWSNIGDSKAYFDEKDYSLNVNGQKILPDIRKYKEMKDLYLKEDQIKDNIPMYLMYRYVFIEGW